MDPVGLVAVAYCDTVGQGALSNPEKINIDGKIDMKLQSHKAFATPKWLFMM